MMFSSVFATRLSPESLNAIRWGSSCRLEVGEGQGMSRRQSHIWGLGGGGKQTRQADKNGMIRVVSSVHPGVSTAVHSRRV